MKRLMVVLNILLVISASFGQNISVSKDTLIFLRYNMNDNHQINDSITVFNSGDIQLTIESIEQKKWSHYTLFYIYNGKIVRTGYTNRNSEIFPIYILPRDSAKLIFEFNEPVTKISSTSFAWNDSLIINNNSINNKNLPLLSFGDVALDVEGESNIPIRIKLFQNYPNPFNPTTNIKYSITKESQVSLKVFDVLGREVEILVNQKQAAGSYDINFDASKFDSGVYIYRLTAGEFVQSLKMILMK
jgi:hypothetical protein